MSKPPVLVLVGPTASGKTALSLPLAQALGAEILAMDSMQVYRGMDVGTAKPTPAERRLVPHHLLDVADPREPFSVSDYVSLCRATLADVRARGRLPLLVGGTGFYLKALMYGLTLGHTPGDSTIRERLLAEAATEDGKRALHERLRTVDPDTAARLHPNDVRRVTRALEVYELTGAPFSRQREEPLPDCPDRFLVFGVELPRALLYERVNARVCAMMDAGLLEEVRTLLDAGVPESAQAMQGLGYKELIPVLLRGAPIEQAVAAIQQGTRHYAKRQLTWFRAEQAVRWVDMTDPETAFARVLAESKQFIEMG